MILLGAGLLLGTLVADALATPPPERLPNWREHKAFLRRLDRVVRDVNELAGQRHLDPRTLRGMSPVQLTGSSVYRLPAFAKSRRLPAFDDFDMRMVGVTLPELKRIVRRHFPDATDDRFEIERSYAHGIRHVQVKLRDRQLDLSLYQTADGFLEPHQRLTAAALKLNLDGDTRLYDLLPRLTTVEGARSLRAERRLLDPSGVGVEDAADGIARTYHLPGMDPVRDPEGILHTAYWTGKYRSGIKVDPKTMQEFKELPHATLKEFFADPVASEAITRRNYVFSSLRVKDGREPLRVVEFLKETEALPKLFPGMDEVLASPRKWERTKQRVRNLNSYVRRSLRGKDIRKARELVLAALLSEVDDIDAALDPFYWPARTGKDDFSRQRIVDAWEWFRKAGPPPVKEE